jgi:hypothetical protein
MLWVVGAGIAVAVYRHARPASWFGPSIDVARLLGLVASLLGVFLVVGLLRQAGTCARRGRAQADVPWLIAVAWRLLAVAVLGALLMVEARLLGDEVSADARSDPQAVRLRLLPLALTLAMMGILAGLAPVRDRDSAGDRPQALQWLSVVCAGVAGIVIAASQTFIPYLVLLAMDAVRNAMPGPMALRPLRPVLPERLLWAGLESGPVLACGFALGLLIARDCRRPAGAGGPEPAPRALLVVTTATALGAVWLITVTLPRLDGWLAERVQATIDPLNAALIAFGFMGLALGLAARATHRPGPSVPKGGVARQRASVWHVLRSVAVALVLIDFIAARAIDLVLARRVTDGGPVDASWRPWVGWVDTAFDWLRSVIPGRRVAPWYVYESPEWIVLALALAWVTGRVALLLLMSIGPKRTPIDASLTDRHTRCALIIRWMALSVLMIAALPTLFLTGLAVLNGVFRLLG